jgi:hypothetical protein
MKLNLLGIGSAILATLFLHSGSPQAAGSSQRFMDECGECHGEAAEFVADWLEFRSGTLTGMGSELPVSEFLKKHRDLEQADIEYYVDLLTRVAGEIGLK